MLFYAGERVIASGWKSSHPWNIAKAFDDCCFHALRKEPDVAGRWFIFVRSLF